MLYTKSITRFEYDLRASLKNLGGALNAHIHLSRAKTADNFSGAKIDLKEKQKIIKDQILDMDRLYRIALDCIQNLIFLNTSIAYACIDIFDEIGHDVFDMFFSLKDVYKDEIDLKIGAYCCKPLTLKNIDLIKSVLKKADFIATLPEIENDVCKAYEKAIGLGEEFRIPVHVHVDQKNDPNENMTELLCDVVGNNFLGDIWAIHVISPSSYPKNRLFKLIDNMANKGIGLICCPSAAIGMQQFPNIYVPMHNSICSIWDFLRGGVRCRLGTDNCEDIFSPSTGLDVVDEAILLTHCTREYDLEKFVRLLKVEET